MGELIHCSKKKDLKPPCVCARVCECVDTFLGFALFPRVRQSGEKVRPGVMPVGTHLLNGLCRTVGQHSFHVPRKGTVPARRTCGEVRESPGGKPRAPVSSWAAGDPCAPSGRSRGPWAPIPCSLEEVFSQHLIRQHGRSEHKPLGPVVEGSQRWVAPTEALGDQPFTNRSAHVPSWKRKWSLPTVSAKRMTLF